MKVRSLFIQSLGIAVLFGVTAFAQDAGSTAGQGGSANTTSADKAAKPEKHSSKSGSSAMDKKFATDAAQGGAAEVELGNLAKSNGSDDVVKQFGDRMATDHSKAGDELKGLAQQKNWNLPSEPKAKDKATKDRLSKLNGAAFDKAYMRDMVMDHEKDVKEFKKCAASCSDPDLKAWAAKTVPTLEDHLKMAKDDAKKVGALNGGKSSKSKKSSESASVGEKPSGAIQ